MPSIASQQQQNDWIQYWNHEKTWTYPYLYETNASIFFDKLQKYFPISNAERILNIGSGPGFLELKLSPFCLNITGVEVSDFMLKESINRCRSRTNVNFLKHPEPYLNYGFLSPNAYDMILCVSVLQYFKDLNEVRSFLGSLLKLSNPNTRILFADLPQERNFFQDVLDFFISIKNAFQGRYATRFIKMAIGNVQRMIKYRRHAQKAPHLFFAKDELEAICREMNLKFQWFDEPFSIVPNRLNLLIRI